MADKILIRGDTYTNWTRRNPVLANREIALVYDGRIVTAKFGDGHTPFNALEYTVFDITVNGARLRPTDTHTANIAVPKQTSALENDGEGLSPFASRMELGGAVHDLSRDITELTGAVNTQVYIIRQELERIEELVDLSDYPTLSDVQDLINATLTAVGSGAVKYAMAFDAETWLGEEPPHIITVPATVHGCGAELFVRLYRKQGDDTHTDSYGAPTQGYTIKINAAGDVTVTAQAAFDGRIIIFG